jgi:zinc transport system substrate-binding protein
MKILRFVPVLRALFPAALALGIPIATAGAEPPRVVASIQPIHSLVARVMDGVGTPTLLVRGANSPHDYSLTPNDARALSDADLVVWVGEALETVLEKPIAALAARARILELMEAPEVLVLEGREGGAWEAHEDEAHAEEAKAHDDHDAAHDHTHDAGHDHHGVDGHIWLDPRNAMAMAAAVAASLSEIDPQNAERYGANAAALRAELAALERELADALAPVRKAPYIVFHDAYQYFERRFRLNAVGSITISPERAPGAKRIGEIRDKLRDTGAVCVFAEPQFEPALARTVVEGTKAKVSVLDPLGASLASGPGAYGALLRGLAESLRGCLIAGS